MDSPDAVCKTHAASGAQNAHRQDYVGIFAALKEIAQNIVGDAPNEGDDFVVGCLIHVSA